MLTVVTQIRFPNKTLFGVRGSPTYSGLQKKTWMQLITWLCLLLTIQQLGAADDVFNMWGLNVLHHISLFFFWIDM